MTERAINSLLQRTRQPSSGAYGGPPRPAVGDQLRARWYESFLVQVAKDGGEGGGDGVDCSYTYTVMSPGARVLKKDVTGAEARLIVPSTNRASGEEYTYAGEDCEAGSFGLAYYDTGGSLVLWLLPGERIKAVAEEGGDETGDPPLEDGDEVDLDPADMMQTTPVQTEWDPGAGGFKWTIQCRTVFDQTTGNWLGFSRVVRGTGWGRISKIEGEQFVAIPTGIECNPE